MEYTGHQRRQRTTVDLPVALAEKIKQAVSSGQARSQNSLILQAIEAYLERLQEAVIDAQFARMAQDKASQALHLQVAEEFAPADWEALQIGEAQR